MLDDDKFTSIFIWILWHNYEQSGYTFTIFCASYQLTLSKNCRWQAISYPRPRPLNSVSAEIQQKRLVASLSLSPSKGPGSLHVGADVRREYVPSAGIRVTMSAVGNDLPMEFND